LGVRRPASWKYASSVHRSASDRATSNLLVAGNEEVVRVLRRVRDHVPDAQEVVSERYRPRLFRDRLRFRDEPGDDAVRIVDRPAAGEHLHRGAGLVDLAEDLVLRIDEELDVHAVHDEVPLLAPVLGDDDEHVDVARRHRLAVGVRAGEEQADELVAELVLQLLDDDLECALERACHTQKTSGRSAAAGDHALSTPRMKPASRSGPTSPTWNQ
jgi:hypothetical protein